MDLVDKLSRGLKATFASQVIYAAANGALMIVLARFLLDPDGYGLLYFALSILGIASLLGTLGVPKSAARYVTEYSENDEAQVPNIVRRSLLYVVALSTTAGAALALLGDRIARFVGEEPVAPLLVVGGGYVLTRSVTLYSQLVLQGFNRVDWSAFVKTLDAVLRFAFVVGFVLLGFGAAGALAGYVVGYAVAGGIGLAIIYVKFYRTFPTDEPMEPGLPRRIKEYSVPLTATQGANVLDKKIDTFLVGFFLTTTAVSFYTLAKQISEFVVTPVTALGFTVSPAYGEQKARDRIETASRLYEESMRHVLLLYIPGAVGLILVAEPLIRLVIGPEYLGATPVLQVLSVFVVFKAINKITSNGLDFLGRARIRAISKSATSVANFLLNLLLIPTIGVVGAAVATVITYSIYTATNVAVMHQEFELSTRQLARDAAGIVAITAGMALAVLVALPYVSGLITLAGVVSLGVAVWAVLAIGSGLLDVRRVTSLLL